MMKKRFSTLSLLSLLLLASCGTTHSEDTLIPKDYEINTTVINDGGVYYEIFVRAFADSDFDGIGDFKGVEDKIPYLQDLGINGVWLMPIMESSSYHGYNVNNYYEVEPDYGSMTDFENMMSAFNKAGIDVILDLVINHTGHQVEWFEKSASYVTGNDLSDDAKKYADWYTWYQGRPNGVAGTFRQYNNTNWYYLANFDGTMPDLNLDNEEVRAEILKIAQFWIDKGVHGFRLDAVLYFYEQQENKNINFLRWFTTEIKKMLPDAYIVGETWISDNAITNYYSSGIDSQFWFGGALVNGTFYNAVLDRNGKLFAEKLVNYDNGIKEKNPNALNSAFLSNHDNNRSAGYAAWGTSLSKQKLAASLYLLTAGVPFMYYGEEIGLRGTGRDENKRLPMVWEEKRGVNKNYEPQPVRDADYNMENQVTKGAYDLLEEPWSLTNHYRKVISLRNEFPGLTKAKMSAVNLGAIPLSGILFEEPSLPNGEILVAHNVGDNALSFTLDYAFKIIGEINTEQVRPIVDGNKITLEKNSTILITKGN